MARGVAPQRCGTIRAVRFHPLSLRRPAAARCPKKRHCSGPVRRPPMPTSAPPPLPESPAPATPLAPAGPDDLTETSGERPMSDSSAEAAEHSRRALKSFVVRAGRMGTGQQRALAELGPRFMLPFQPGTLLQPAEVFGRSAPLVLEIGFGMGAATAEIAAARPDTDFLGGE
eukprot:gene17975-24453_t